jgi:hypothetical protein
VCITPGPYGQSFYPTTRVYKKHLTRDHLIEALGKIKGGGGGCITRRRFREEGEGYLRIALVENENRIRWPSDR